MKNSTATEYDGMFSKQKCKYLTQSNSHFKELLKEEMKKKSEKLKMIKQSSILYRMSNYCDRVILTLEYNDTCTIFLLLKHEGKHLRLLEKDQLKF